MPAAIPFTIPVTEPIAATEGLPLVQVPPETALLNVTEPLPHIGVLPDIVPASGNGLTVTALVATAVPQPLVTEYDMVVVPADAPVTIPVALPIAAIVVLDDVHTPPPAALLRVVVAPAQTAAVPVIAPALGSGFTVPTVVTVAVPQLFVTV